jgi:hypothetical protein
MTTRNPQSEDRQNKGLDHDASRHAGDGSQPKQPPSADDPRDGVAGVGRGLDEETGGTSSGFGA